VEPARVRGLSKYANEQNIGSDWSVLEEAASMQLGEGNASVGGIEFSAPATSDSMMVGRKSMTLETWDRGSAGGVTADSSVSEGVVQVSADSVVARLNVERNSIASIPFHPERDASGNVITFLDEYNAWSFQELGIETVDFRFIANGFHEDASYYGNTAVAGEVDGKPALAVFSNGGSLLYFQVYDSISGSVSGLTFDRFNNVLLAINGVGIYIVEPASGDAYGWRGSVAEPRMLLLDKVPAANARGFNTIGFVYRTYIVGNRQLMFPTANGNVVWTDAYSAAEGATLSTSIWSSGISPATTQPPGISFQSNWSSGTDMRDIATISGPAGSASIQRWRAATNVAGYGANESSIGFIAGAVDIPESTLSNVYVHSQDGTRRADLFWLPSDPQFLTYYKPKSGSGTTAGVSLNSILVRGYGIRRFLNFYSKSILLEQALGTVRPYTGFVLEGYGIPGLAEANEFSDIAIVPWVDNVWNKVNEFAQATKVTIVPSGDFLAVSNARRPSELEVENPRSISWSSSVGSPTRYVAVESLNAQFSLNSFPTFYQAYEDNDASFSVDVGETVVEELVTTNYPAWLMPLVRTNSLPDQKGPGQYGYTGSQYYLIAADNLPVAPGQFEFYGGSVAVSISTTTPGAIDLTITGPSSQIPGVAGPFTIGISDGQQTHGALSIAGSGTITRPETLVFSTGADWSVVTEEINDPPIQNVYLTDRVQAIKRGRALAQRSGANEVTLSLSIPASQAADFGFGAGTVHRFNDGLWRIISLEHSSDEVQVTFQQYNAGSEFEAAWAGKTGAEFDAQWSGYKADDFRIAPLRVPE
jgi:hypothetical protein